MGAEYLVQTLALASRHVPSVGGTEELAGFADEAIFALAGFAAVCGSPTSLALGSSVVSAGSLAGGRLSGRVKSGGGALEAALAFGRHAVVSVNTTFFTLERLVVARADLRLLAVGKADVATGQTIIAHGQARVSKVARLAFISSIVGR